jgi:hypothetical protein
VKAKESLGEMTLSNFLYILLIDELVHSIQELVAAR